MANRTWLQLSQDLRREAGVQGTGPSAVTGQTGIYENLVSWIQQAWTDIQSEFDSWSFRKGYGSFTTTNGPTRDYTLDPEPSAVEPHSFTATDSAGNVTQIEFLDYSLFQERYRLYSVNDAQPPSVCTLLPDGVTLRFRDYTEADYTVNYDYTAAVVQFANSTDTATFPPEFDMILVWKALIDYGLFYNAQEALQHGKIRYDEFFAKLKDDQLIRPTIRIGGFINGRNRAVSRYW